jgi:Type II secretion system (T2SS), protein F
MTGEVVHSLGMTLLIASGALCAAAALPLAASARRARAVRRRREWLLGAERGRRPRRPRLRGVVRPEARRWAAPVAVGTAVTVLVGGFAGCVAGPVAAYGIRRWQRRRGPRTAPEADEAARQLPPAAELLAACLAAGAAPGAAADAVGRTVGGPLGTALRRVAAEVRLGGDPAQCWSRLGALPGAYDLGRWMASASTTGVPPVAAVARLAAEYRAAGVRSAGARARRAAVLATAPLGLCFLPAFLAVGVVPVVIGLAGAMTRPG